MAYTDYSTLVADSPEELTTRLTQSIADGWQPYGAPVCITLQQFNKSFRLMQAVVKGTPNGGGGDGPSDIAADDITDASVIGKAVLTCADEQAARDAIGAIAAPPEGDAGKLQTGTETVPSLWSAKVISDEIKRQIAAIPPA